jgi:hypothetical protein
LPHDADFDLKKYKNRESQMSVQGPMVVYPYFRLLSSFILVNGNVCRTSPEVVVPGKYQFKWNMKMSVAWPAFAFCHHILGERIFI